ncbi:MAG: hypothetical protein HYS63_01345 [Methylocystis sp.]|nr:hypothetical protein [Methylocystis sp.]
MFDNGIFGVGRTGATATFEPLGAAIDVTGLGKIRLDDPPLAESLPSHADLYAITLITPALMTDPRRIEAEPIEEQYEALIARQTGGELACAFTSRRLAGGYIATRRRPYGKDAFYPFVLTEPGSVFLVRNGEPSKLKEIARWGFFPVALTGVDELTWRNCPYVRENGYGEAAFSLVDHIGLGKRGRG